jgi:hypothetical protein
MNQQPDLDKVMDEFKSTDEVRALKPLMLQPCFIQTSFPIALFSVTPNGPKLTGEFTQSFVGIMQPSMVPDRVFVQVPGSPIVLMPRAKDIEMFYVIVAQPEPNRIITP